MTTPTTTQAKRALTINLVFILGLIMLAAGLYLFAGLAIALTIIGGLLIFLALVAVKTPTTVTIDNKGSQHAN